MFRRIKNWFKRKKKKPTVYRDRPSNQTNSDYIKVKHPLAVFKEDMNKLYTPYSFKFDKDHYFCLHFTAGRFQRKARDFFSRFIEMGLCTYFIDGNNTLWQQHDGDKCGHHAGVTRWKNKSISKKVTGVEVACAGKVRPIGNGTYESWFGKQYSTSEVREVTKDMLSENGYTTTGFFVKFSDEQETLIAELMAWHIAKGLPKENIKGHDHIAWKRGRKNDPSGSLSLPLDIFIKEQVIPLVHKYQENL